MPPLDAVRPARCRQVASESTKRTRRPRVDIWLDCGHLIHAGVDAKRRWCAGESRPNKRRHSPISHSALMVTARKRGPKGNVSVPGNSSTVLRRWDCAWLAAASRREKPVRHVLRAWSEHAVARSDRRAAGEDSGPLRQSGWPWANPRTSAVQGADRLRELRLRAGRSPWRARMVFGSCRFQSNGSAFAAHLVCLYFISLHTVLGDTCA